MSILDKIKSAVWEEEKKPEAVAIKPETASATVPAAQATSFIGGVTGTVNEEILNILNAALTSNKTVYTTFKETSNKISGVIVDEATRYKTAMATIGTTKEDLISALDGCTAILDSEKQKCTSNLDATVGKEIGVQTQHNEQLDKAIADLNSQLSQLTEEKLKTEQLLGELQTQYATFGKNFDATLASISNELNVERKKLEIYL